MGTSEKSAGGRAGEAARHGRAAIRFPGGLVKEAVKLVQAMEEPGRPWELVGKRERVDRTREMIRAVLTLEGPENGRA